MKINALGRFKSRKGAAHGCQGAPRGCILVLRWSKKATTRPIWDLLGLISDESVATMGAKIVRFRKPRTWQKHRKNFGFSRFFGYEQDGESVKTARNPLREAKIG